MILSQFYTYALLMAFPGCLVLAGLSDFMTMTISNRLCAAIAILFPFAALQFGLPLSAFAGHMGVGLAVFVLDRRRRRQAPGGFCPLDRT